MRLIPHYTNIWNWQAFRQKIQLLRNSISSIKGLLLDESWEPSSALKQSKSWTWFSIFQAQFKSKFEIGNDIMSISIFDEINRLWTTNHASPKSLYYRYFIRIFCWQFTFVQMLHFRLKFLYCHLLHFWCLNDQFESKVPNRTKNEFGHDQFWLYSSRGWYVKPCISAHILVFKTVLFATSDTTQRRELGVWPTFNLLIPLFIYTYPWTSRFKSGSKCPISLLMSAPLHLDFSMSQTHKDNEISYLLFFIGANITTL